MFPDAEDSVWSRDDDADAWYLHQFYRFQPDLNIESPAVRAELRKIIALWLQLGASGFRVDAASHMLGAEALQPSNEHQPPEFLRFVCDAATSVQGNSALLAEADVSADELSDYFGDGNEMHLMLTFLFDNHLFLALARQEVEPVRRALDLLPDKPAIAQRANFLRNLDELDLEPLTDDEPAEVYDAFAPDEEMRVFGRGIRRRIAPMLGGDRQRLELDWSLLFSLPDTPLIVYSDEIGMGEDLSLPERTSVRTPMQWSVETNGGFSTGDRRWLSTPPIEDGPFGYPAVNVVAQRRDCDSLLTWMQRLIFIRRQCPEIGRGEYTLQEAGHPAVLAMRFDWEDGTVIAFHNLSAQPVCATVCDGEDLPRPLIEIFGANEHSGGDIVLARVELVGFGYRWLRCGSMRL